MLDALKNAVVFDSYNTPFHDAFAQFSVNFPADKPLGPGMVFPRATQFTFQVAEALLRLWLVDEHGQPVAVPRQELECWPWLTRETAGFPLDPGSANPDAKRTESGSTRGLHIAAEHVLADECRLVSEFSFENRADRPLTIHPRWQGIISGDRYVRREVMAEFEGLNSTPRITFLKAHPGGIRGGMCVPDGPPHLPQTALTVVCASQPLTAWLGRTPFWSGAESRPVDFIPGPGLFGHYLLGAGESLTLKPGERRTYQFITHVAYAWYRRPAFDWPAADLLQPVNFETLRKDRRAAFERNLNLASLPQTGSPALDHGLARARYTLLRDGVRGMGGEYGDNIACLCGPNAGGFNTVFFWDSLFSSVALADFHPEYARGAIRTPFTRQLPRDGASPENGFNYPIPQRFMRQFPQAPVASWAVLKYLEKNRDPEFLASIYPTLVNNHRYWEDFADRDRDGLAEWNWTGQTADNSPLYDPYNLSHGCTWLPPIASVALNSFLYKDAKHLADLAGRLGQPEDATRYQTRADRLFDRFMEVCFVPGERRFWDYNHQSGQHRRIRTFYLFWPLYAGMPVPREIARHLIEEVLLDPKQFFGPIPFPSVAYDEPTYDPRGYWRGKAWPHITYWLLETLVRYGYAKEAEEAARRVLARWSATRGFYENTSTQPDDEEGGTMDYNWGIAAFYLIATKEYLKAEPGQPTEKPKT